MTAARLDNALTRGREVARSRMQSTTTGRHNAGRGTPDPTTGHAPITWGEVYSAGACRLGGMSRGAASSRTEKHPGGEVRVATRTLHLPHGTSGIGDGDVFRIDSGEYSGTFWCVTESNGADQRTAVRLPVYEVPRPEDWP